MLKRIINITIWTLLGLYFAIVVLLHIPFVQTFIGERVSDALCEKFGTKVNVGRVDLGFANRLIVDNTLMYDQRGKQMLRVARISVKINPLALVKGQIEISSAQFFGLHANLYRLTPNDKDNFQFVVDSLASKDTTKQKTPLDLQINSLIIRRGNISYRVLSQPSVAGRFSTNDMHISDLSAHIIVNRITNDSVNVKVKKLALKERCGFMLKSLSLTAVASRRQASVRHLRVELPHTIIESDSISATYRTDDKQKLLMPTLKFCGNLNATATPSDFACFVPQLRSLGTKYTLSTNFYGTGSSAVIQQLTLNSADNHLRLSANGAVSNYPENTEWSLNLNELTSDNANIATVYKAVTGNDLPAIAERVGHVAIKGYAGGKGSHMVVDGNVVTDLGTVAFAAEKHQKTISGNIETTAFDLGKLVAQQKVGQLSAKLNIRGTSADDIAADGTIYDITYNGYQYKTVNLDAAYCKKIVKGSIEIDDPNVSLIACGMYDGSQHTPQLSLSAAVSKLSPHALRLTNKWQGTSFEGNVDADIAGSGLHNANGKVSISDFCMHKPDYDYCVKTMAATTGFDKGEHYLNLNGDFGNAELSGHFSYNTIVRSMLNLLTTKLTTIPGLAYKPQTDTNNFTIDANIHDARLLEEFLDVPLQLHQPLLLSGALNDADKTIDITCRVPSFSYAGTQYKDAHLKINTPNDTLKADIGIKKISAKGKALSLRVNAGACDNRLLTSLRFSDSSKHPLRGVANASTMFAKDANGVSTAYVDIQESEATVGDTTWHVAPSSIIYQKNNLRVDGFAIRHGNQHITINGRANNNMADSLVVSLKDIDVSYILNLVNFHSVDFAGRASGSAVVAGAFCDQPRLEANVKVDNFLFEEGRMGTLFANVGYNYAEQKIEINATAADDDQRNTYINGYVSPKHNYIDLGITADRSRAEFMESFCGSFMDNINAEIVGKVNVVGPLNKINLVGEAVVNGTVHMSALGTTYVLHNDTVRMIPDEIRFCNDTIYDRHGNIGILTGGVYHTNLKNLTYDIGVKAHNLLAYDTHSFDGGTFYGTAYTTGTCNIKGKSGEVTIDIDAVPEKNSILVYNVSDNGSIGSSDYITWKKHDAGITFTADGAGSDANKNADKVDVTTNIHLNFLINCNTNATLKLLMDERTGDYITLNGDGILRASYFNKGSFDLYGNYIVDHGVYKLTIQNIIKKDFQFLKGGTIAFGGDPYNASLDLKAQYVLNSVSLADLNIGKSFANNNVRVNCLMNITGNPNAPKVDFNLDMPTLSNDAKQMVHSVLNAEEETNQQVLYLLAVGRFYAPSTNNSNANIEDGVQQYSQTSLAMQSFLSGTISQQLNSVLSNVIDNSNWNFGANISTGTEGFNNAEYEGLLSGRMLNNRLLFNGQFGYRDNPNATTTIIGDFDLRYLLFPNGNLAINVYNKTNDRYFTRNSLNTQGIGIIMKKDFTRVSDLFFWKRRKNK